MLKFYSLDIPASLSNFRANVGWRGRYFLVSDGKRFAAYNESSYSTAVFGERPHEICVGDDEYTDLCHAVQRVVYTYVEDRRQDPLSVSVAEEVAQSLMPMPEFDMVLQDHIAHTRLLEYMFYRRYMSMQQRVTRWARARTARLARRVGDLATLRAYYKGYSLATGEYESVKQQRSKLAAYVAQGVQNDDWEDEEIRCHLENLRFYNTRFVDSDLLDKLRDLSNGEVDLEICDCGHIEHNSETHDVRNDTWCDRCFDDEAVYVEDRDAWWPRDDAYYHESNGQYYSYEEDNEDDDDDDNEDEPNNLLSYSTNVLRHVEPDKTIKSGPFGNFTMGVELEMCSGRGRTISEAIDDVRSELGESYCVCKSDGSLPGDGFEVVTAPRGLEEHIRRFKAWNVHSSYRAWNAGSCGLHVHIDSRAFTPMTLGKFLMFINDDNNADFIRSLAGRHPKTDSQARHYCAADDQTLLANPKKAVKGKDSSRYRMVNVCNMDRDEMQRLGINHYNFDTTGRKFNTVELRIFRASLKKERLLAQIEFTHAAVMFVRSASYRDLTHGAFKGWLAKSYALYPHLAAWYEVAPKKKANPNAVAVVAADETTV